MTSELPMIPTMPTITLHMSCHCQPVDGAEVVDIVVLVSFVTAVFMSTSVVMPNGVVASKVEFMSKV